MGAHYLAHELTGLLRDLDIRRADHEVEHAGAHVDIATGTDVISRHAPEEGEFFLDVLYVYLLACPGETWPRGVDVNLCQFPNPFIVLNVIVHIKRHCAILSIITR